MSKTDKEPQIDSEFLHLFANDILKNSSSDESEIFTSDDENLKDNNEYWDEFKNINVVIDKKEVKFLKKIINYMININK
jgi:ligand-binding sensor protein